ncbi:putative phage shock protein B [delta proteobacterium NaphS2]|nr:putative phage shock protein B [delta proteobacterium NaphS2]
MHGAIIVAIIFGGLILCLAIVGGTILMGIKIKKGGLSPRDQRSQQEETRMIQEIYRGLEHMEERIEALETIILKGRGKDEVI